MKKILAFSFFPAFVPPSNGGQARLYHFYKALSEWFDITLLTSTHIGVEEETVNHGVRFRERRIPKDRFFTDQWSALGEYSSGGDLSGPCIAACGKFPTRLHQAYLEEYEEADIVVHDSPFTVECDLFAGLDQKLRVYNSYNCETRLYRQLHDDPKSRPIHEIVRLAETRMIESADLVFHCSPDDLAAFREMAPNAGFEAFHVPNGVTPMSVPERPVQSGKAPFAAVFMGSNHPPNAHAAEFIVRELAPRLPDITFDIIGSCLSEGEYPSNVRRHGIVDDALKNRLLREADLALNPMDSGSGSNVKVLDFLSNGLLVLSTPFGMRGVQAEAGKEYLEASLDGFPEAIRAAAADRDLLAATGAAGKALALSRYTWRAIAQSTVQHLDHGVESKASAVSAGFVLALNDYDSFAIVGGGGTRTQGLYRAVSRWRPVVFMSFSDNDHLQARKFAEGITVVNVPKTANHLEELSRVNSQFHVSAADIVAGRHCLLNPYLAIAYRVLRQSASCIVIEHCYMADLPRVWGDRFVYSSQNNETELKKRLLEGHPLKDGLLKDVEQRERFAVEGSAATIAVSRDDAESLVRGKRTAGPVIVVRNGAAAPAAGEAFAKAADALRGKIRERSALFVGSAHMPNVEAARCITEQIAPKCGDVQFHLMGPICNAVLEAPSNVCLWGVTDDATKSAVMSACALAVNPMLSGSGSNVKLADYLGHGLYAITTEFGRRGYPPSIGDHVEVAAIERFHEAIRSALKRPELFSSKARQARRELFFREFALDGLAGRFVDTLRGLEVKRKRVLYVAYRYTSPPQGGAEVNMEKFISALGHSGTYDVDVVAPEVSGIHSRMRFSETYSFDRDLGVPIDIPNVRFARFPADKPEEAWIDGWLRTAWRIQPLFERSVNGRLSSRYTGNGLSWGWGYPEGEPGSVARRAFSECGIHAAAPARIEVAGHADSPITVTAMGANGILAGPKSVEGVFRFDFQADAGEILLGASAPERRNDPRPTGFLLTGLAIAGKPIDLSERTLIQRHLQGADAETAFRILDQAAAETRGAHNVRLTDGRGPWSASLERFIADRVADYDLVIAHNNIFRPAVVAIREAKRHGVPSILIPHVHLDDDFYHFPDVLESARDAGLVMAVPRAACHFLAGKGCNVRYLPAGCDAREAFTPRDERSFKRLYRSDRPFVLVLGRKAGAKGYRRIIEAVEQLNRCGVHLHVLLIGPDDDGAPVNSPNATYLGRQPRDVVRGALMCCMALCNMSISESFGIVLLEAWLAGKPVIVNKNCAAFHDMAVDGENALMVGDEELPNAIRTLASQPELRSRLAAKGKAVAEQYDWTAVSDRFLSTCADIAL